VSLGAPKAYEIRDCLIVTITAGAFCSLAVVAHDVELVLGRSLVLRVTAHPPTPLIS
jgi:hypothetical protein